MRRNRKIVVFLIAAVVSSLLLGCSPAAPQDAKDKQLAGQIFLLGEAHGLESYYQKEFEIWSAYYNEYGMRDLFREEAYYTSEYLNLWMHADSDDILNELYQDWEGTAAHCQAALDFLKRIKAECPETVFHGTDVGHQFFSTGERFLEYLASTGQSESEAYQLTQECMEQGRVFYGGLTDGEDSDWAYREDCMAENFIRELEKTDGAGVMGIYGGAHTDVTAMNYGSQEVPSMARQLQERYGEVVHIRNLCAGLRTDDPYTDEPLQEDRTEQITVGEKTYTARYLGKTELDEKFPEYQYREFWVLEDAFLDFRDKPTHPNPDDVLPCDNYPGRITVGQVFAIDYTRADGSVERVFQRYDTGNFVYGRYATIGFDPESDDITYLFPEDYLP